MTIIQGSLFDLLYNNGMLKVLLRIASLLVETVPLDMHRFKSKKGASVWEELAHFN